MKCVNCGAELNDGQVFCSNCGYRLDSNNNGGNSDPQNNIMNNDQQLAKPKKKKTFWWVPVVLFFVGMVGTGTIRITLSIIIESMKNDVETNVGLINFLTGVHSVLGIVWLVSGLLVVPSIFVVVIYNIVKK